MKPEGVPTTIQDNGVKQMKAAEVMVSNVITVSPEASVQDVANILLTNRISAVPVVTAKGELVGIVSEGDLIRRVETDTEHRRSWWIELLIGRGPLATEYVKSHSHKVSDLMSRDVITATPDTPLRDIAGLLEKNGIKRVPIVKNRKLVGIVSRANLVQALAAQKKQVDRDRPVDDLTIREEIMARLDGKLWTKFAPVNVIVRNGVVDLWGIVDSDSVKQAVRVAVEETAGVRGVNDNLSTQRIAHYV
jgi:CBS domain-containing protein